MTRKPWLQPLVLGAVVVISMLLGGVVAARSGGRSARSFATVATAASSTHPVAATSGTAAGARVTGSVASSLACSIADVVDRVRQSAVLIEGVNDAGSGLVIDRDGHILTNYHVVEGQQTLKVKLSDGSASTATVLGFDPGSDLAVIQATFPADRLIPATLGNSDQVRTGDAVFAIGAPFNQPFTVTSGIISATGRTTQSSFTGRSIRDVLQTDAAVNPGNSGGPLFNMNGEVIGINTSIENPNGRFFIGLGFAIPSNTVLRFLPALIAGQTIKHPQLGVSVLALDDVIAKDLGLGVGRGVYVTSVQPASAAARAGVVAAPASRSAQSTQPARGGDVIVSLDGQTIASFEDLARAIDRAEVGKNVSIVVVRGGQQQTLTATLQPWDLQSN